MVVPIVSVFQNKETEYNGNFLNFGLSPMFFILFSGILIFVLIGSSLILIRLDDLAVSLPGLFLFPKH